MRLRAGLLIVHLLAISILFALPTAAWADEPESSESTAKEKQQDADEALKETADYYDLLRLFADTIDQIERNYVKPVDRRELMEAAIRGLTRELDPYSTYIGPEDIDAFRDNIDAEFGGVGIQVALENGQLKIISPLVGTPAYRAGLMSGDSIVRIEGESTEGITLQKAVRLMKGKPETDVTITVIHAHDLSEETVTLRREIIRVETVLGDQRNEQDKWEFMLDDEDKIGFVRLTAFSRHTAGTLRDAINELNGRGMRGLVLDFRYNPGGLLSSAVKVSDMFVSSGVIVSTEGRNTKKRVWPAHAADTFTQFPIVVMVNRYSASASEIVAACLQDHERAVVVGERTWGKGSVQEVIDLENGKSALKLTTAGYQRPSGRNIHRFHGADRQDEWGVTPNEGFEVTMTLKETSDYLEYRRERDIISSKSPAADGTNGNLEADSEVESPDAPPESDDQGDNNDPPSEDQDPSDPESNPESTDEEESESTDEEDSESTDEEEKASEEELTGDQIDEKAEQTFVDRQLERALQYLRENLEASNSDQ